MYGIFGMYIKYAIFVQLFSCDFTDSSIAANYEQLFSEK